MFGPVSTHCLPSALIICPHLQPLASSHGLPSRQTSSACMTLCHPALSGRLTMSQITVYLPQHLAHIHPLQMYVSI
jgi:hypothetical protein